jgi:hypothetical protein
MRGEGKGTWLTAGTVIALVATLLSVCGGFLAIIGLDSHTSSSDTSKLALAGAFLANAGLLLVCVALVLTIRRRGGADGEPRPDAPVKSEREMYRRLKEMLNRDEVRRMILGGHKVAHYSLGVIAEPTAEERWAFELSVEGTDHLERFPRSLGANGRAGVVAHGFS